jgi:hypothetical protein
MPLVFFRITRVPAQMKIQVVLEGESLHAAGTAVYHKYVFVTDIDKFAHDSY